MHDTLNQKPEEKCPSPAKQQGWRVLREAVNQKRVLSWLLALGILYTLYLAKDLLYPVFIALYLTTLFQPLVYGLRRIRIPPLIGAVVMVASMLYVLFFAFMWLSVPASDWLDRAPGLIREAGYKLYSFKKNIEEARKTTEQLQEMTDVDAGKREKVVIEGPSLTQQAVGHTKNFSVTALIVIVLLYLFLSQGQAFLNQLAGALGDRKAHMQLLHDIRHEITRYLLTISVINFTLGVVTAAMIALFGMPNPLLWGAVAGVFNFIPYLGGAVTTVILAIVSFITYDRWLDILLPPLLFILINGLEGYIITPVIVGKRLSLNPIVIFLSLLFWGWIWGVVGLFLATPILVTVLISANKLNLLELQHVATDEPKIRGAGQ